MEKTIDPRSKETRRVPEYVRQRAIKEGKQVLHIVWDKAGGYPEHAWGFQQWSVRPYVLGYGCDGTTDGNIHYIALQLCERLGLDYPALYEQAYAQDEVKEQSWLRTYDWDREAQETIVPELSEVTLRGLLHDLGEINCRSILAVLEDEFTRLGYHVDEWWNYRNDA